MVCVVLTTCLVRVIPIERLEEFVRDDLNANSRRIFAVYDPVKVIIKNWTSTPFLHFK